MSLMVVGTPSTLDKGVPLRHRVVDSFAIAKAASASISENALNRSCTCSARASVLCATSRGVNFPELKPAVSSPTPNRHSSFASARNRLFIIIPMAKRGVGEIDGKLRALPCQSGASSASRESARSPRCDRRHIPLDAAPILKGALPLMALSGHLTVARQYPLSGGKA